MYTNSKCLSNASRYFSVQRVEIINIFSLLLIACFKSMCANLWCVHIKKNREKDKKKYQNPKHLESRAKSEDILLLPELNWLCRTNTDHQCFLLILEFHSHSERLGLERAFGFFCPLQSSITFGPSAYFCYCAQGFYGGEIKMTTTCTLSYICKYV